MKWTQLTSVKTISEARWALFFGAIIVLSSPFTLFAAPGQDSAIALAPIASSAIAVSGPDLCLRACKRGGEFQINLDPQGTRLTGDVTLRVLDPMGRVVRTLDWKKVGSGNAASATGRQTIWDGMDSRGQPVAWGTYFLNATSKSTSVTLLLSWVP